MARVFEGKMVVPEDQMETYLEALGQFEQDKAPLRTQLEHYAQDFARALADHATPKTVRKHTAILALFIDFVCWNTDVQQLGEITRGIANSQFRQWYQRKVRDQTESELKTTIKRFFTFLAEEKGLRNGAVLQSFRC
jgi:site-specific recombinase XerD